MDTSRYNFKKLNESNNDGIFHQEFIDDDKHVKYIRVTWDPSDISKEELDVALGILFDSLEIATRILPNVVKSEVGDNYYELLTFSDDDIEFNSNKLLPKIIKKAIMSNSEILGDYGNINYFKELNKVIRSLPEIPEYSEAIKEIYKNYIDKEL